MNLSYTRVMQFSVIIPLKYCSQLILNPIFKFQYQFFVRSYSSNILLTKQKNLTVFENELVSVFESSYIINDYDAITDGDPRKLKLLKLCQLEVDLSDKLPNHLTTDEWRKLISYDSKRLRRRYLRYLWLKQAVDMEREHLKKRKHLKYADFLEKKARVLPIQKTTNSPMDYNLNNVTVVPSISRQKMTKFYNFKLLQAMIFGPEIILDMSYEQYMSEEEHLKCVKQIKHMFSSNRNNDKPFHIIFCNVKKECGILLPLLSSGCPKLLNVDYPFTYTEKNYLDLFPKEKLVYLSPHAEDELDYYDPNFIYIIGAFVDLRRNPIISPTKAYEDGIRTAKFPLDKYLDWQQGPKSLALYQVLRIMSDLKDKQNWQYALGNISDVKASREKYLIEKKLNFISYESVVEKQNRLLLYDLLLGKN